MSIPLINYWYQALESPIGIIIETDDRNLLRQHLWLARRKAFDPELENLQLSYSHNPNEVWIWHKATRLRNAPTR